MNAVHQHPDGLIFVRVGPSVYMDTPANLNADFGVVFPELPKGAIERIYVPEVRHVISSDVTVISGGAMPWVLGDTLIANISVGLAAQAVRKG